MSNGSSSGFPCIGIGLVFIALLTGYSFQLKSQMDQRAQLKKAEAAYRETMPQVDTLKQKLQRVSEDLLENSNTSPAARQIINEFSIRRAGGK